MGDRQHVATQKLARAGRCQCPVLGLRCWLLPDRGADQEEEEEEEGTVLRSPMCFRRRPHPHACVREPGSLTAGSAAPPSQTSVTCHFHRDSNLQGAEAAGKVGNELDPWVRPRTDTVLLSSLYLVL